jgi:hypothetical protein
MFVASMVTTINALSFAHASINVSPIWPVNGLILAGALRVSRRRRAHVLAAGLAGLMAGVLASRGAAYMAALDGLEIMLTLALLDRFAPQRVDLTRFRDVLIFTCIAFFTPAVSAGLATIARYARFGGDVRSFGFDW